MVMKLTINGSKIIINMGVINFNGIDWKAIGRFGGIICVQYIGTLVFWLLGMVLQSILTSNTTFAHTISTIVKGTS
jgi:hypothetical protein